MSKKATFASILFQQQMLFLLVCTLVAIMGWVGFSIYFSYTKTTLTPTDISLIAPLNPRLDSTLFTKLATRKNWTDEELASFQPSIQIPIDPTKLPSPLPSLVSKVATTSGGRKVKVATTSAQLQ